MQVNMLSLQWTAVVFCLRILFSVLDIQSPRIKCSVSLPASSRQSKTCYFYPLEKTGEGASENETGVIKQHLYLNNHNNFADRHRRFFEIKEFES